MIRKLSYSLVLSLALLLTAATGTALAQSTVSIAFVLDESGSIDSGELGLQQRGYRDALTRLPADGSIEVSVIYFSDGVRVAQEPVPLTPANLPGLLSALDGRADNGTTNMTAGIQTAAQRLATSAAQTLILCLSTDGAPDSSASAMAAADAARATGIDVSPVGIGLGTSGETFLNAIASEPPVPNPASFTEFAEVIVTKIGAGVGAALNVAVVPDPLDFGTFPDDPTLAPACGNELEARLVNRSDRSATIEDLRIVGQDAVEYRLVSIDGGQPSFPFDLPPGVSHQLVLALEPTSSPSDRSYDAVFQVVATNDQIPDSRVLPTTMTATVDPQLENCLSLDVADAAPLVTEIDGSGIPRTGSGDAPSETTVAGALDRGTVQNRRGVVADGNARLLLRARTASDEATMIRFEIDPPGTGAGLFMLDGAQKDDGSQTLQVPVEELSNGDRQATAILRAPERFRGDAQAPRLDFEIKACLPETGGCSRAEVTRSLQIWRAPIVLIHGLWSDNTAWQTVIPLGSSPTGAPIVALLGMRPELHSAHFLTHFFQYDGAEGPSVEMTAQERGLADSITEVCEAFHSSGFACTRSDLVVHSMGGLVARKFVHDNEHFQSDGNFGEGSVRRILSLGTPYNGSPLASYLRFGILVGDPSPQCAGAVGSRSLLVVEVAMQAAGYEISSAIDDLIPGGQLVQELANPDRTRPTRALYGNIGRRFSPRALGWAIWLLGCSYDDLFQESSDGIVPVSSATAGSFPAARIDDAEGEGISHTSLPNEDTVIEATQATLLGPRTPGFQRGPVLSTPRNFRSPAPNTMRSAGDTLVTSLAQSQPTVASVELAASDLHPLPGSVITFEVVDPPAGLTEMALTDGQDLFLLDSDSPPFEWQVSIPDLASGTARYVALGSVDGILYRSNEVTLTVTPDVSGLRQLAFEPNDPLVLSSGSTEQLRVTGLFTDGHRRNLTEAVVGTEYSERIVDGIEATPGDSPVLEIGPDGLLTAREPGTADVVATNNGVTTVRRVTVRAVSEDDTDGDGLVDAAEAAIGTDPFDRDTDDDGSDDGEEVGPLPQSPSDGDGDGIPDALDPSIRTVRDTAGNPVSVSTTAGRICRLFGRSTEDFPERPTALSDAELPAGLFDFSVCELDPGATVEVGLRFAGLADPPDAYLKFIRGQWMEFSGVSFRNDRVVLRLTDGGEGDSDPRPGVIRDPGGPAYFGPAQSVLDIPTLSEWGLLLLALILALAAVAILGARLGG